MAKQYSKHQQSIIKNYYENKPAIKFEQLQTALSDLYLATSDKKRENLWKKIDVLLYDLDVAPADISYIMQKRDLTHLAEIVKNLY